MMQIKDFFFLNYNGIQNIFEEALTRIELIFSPKTTEKQSFVLYICGIMNTFRKVLKK